VAACFEIGDEPADRAPLVLEMLDA
jgi:hypothetical protein